MTPLECVFNKLPYVNLRNLPKHTLNNLLQKLIMYNVFKILVLNNNSILFTLYGKQNNTLGIMQNAAYSI